MVGESKSRLWQRRSHSIGGYDITVENSLLKCRVYWARVIGSETESLFTQSTKHTFYEIEYALEGRIEMLIEGNRKIFLEPSEIVIIPPDTFHQIVDGDSVGTRFIMAFSLDVKSPLIAALPSLLRRVVPIKESIYMRALLEMISERSYRDNPLRERLVECYLECFLLELAEEIMREHGSGEAYDDTCKDSKERVRVERITKFISERGGIGISCKEIAEHFSISERHLFRIFTAVTGASLKETIDRKKLERVEELVTSTDLSFGEISELCGFSDEYTMNKFFKRRTRYSLGEYRALRGGPRVSRSR